MLRIYGTAHDPDEGTEFIPSGDTLRLALSQEKRLLSHSILVTSDRVIQTVNAPRVWRDVRGDFTVTVRVSFPIRAKVPPKHGEKDEARASGGLVVWTDSGNFLTVTRDEQDIDGKPRELFRENGDGQIIETEGSVDLKRSGYLRVKRKGKELEGSYSTDGKEWEDFLPDEVDWPDTVKVGVVAENSYKAPFEVVFDEYSLTRPK